MSAVIVIIDGAGKEDYKDCESITSAARILFDTHTPKDKSADSLNCIMSLLGYPACRIPDGRAYLEALANNITVGDEDLVMRLNGVEIKDGVLTSSCISRSLPSVEYPFEVFEMGTYKNLLIIKDAAALSKDMTTFPPHENIGKKTDDMQIICSDKRLQKEINKFYELGFWPWGQSTKTYLPIFGQFHGKSAAMVCATEIVRGIAKATGIYCPYINDTTADTDTSVENKLKETLSLMGKYDYVFVHLNGADEAAHRRDQNEKVAFIKSIDENFVKPLLKAAPQDSGIAVTSDHYTDAGCGAHSAEKVPTFILRESEDILLWQKYL